MEAINTTTMADEHQSTDESDIDAFLEYARYKVAENDLSYDTTSFLDFEALLQDCIANHFLDPGVGDNDADSMASEASFSGYVNDGCDNGARYKSAVLMKKDIMSNNAYHRMKGIIARRKKNEAGNDKSHPTDASIGKENTDNNSVYSIEYQFEKSRKNPKIYHSKSIPKSKAARANDTRNDSIQSDSSDSILDDLVPRQTRPRRPRRRPNKKKAKGAFTTPHIISKESNPMNGLNVSTLTSDSLSKGKALHSSSEQARSTKGNSLFCTDESDTTDLSSIAARPEMLIETRNAILPSLVKKGIKYYDVPKIEKVLERMMRQTDTIDQKQKVFDELFATRPMQVEGTHDNKQKGMALVHKLRAERKMALQTAFLRYSGKEGNQEPSKVSVPEIPKDENLNVSVPDNDENEIIVYVNDAQSPSSLSSFSSFEEKKRFNIFTGKTRRTLTHSFQHDDKEGLLQNNVHDDEVWMNSSYSSPDEGVLVPKTSPFGKIKFPRIKEIVHYEELSTSSLTNDTWNDSGEYSAIVRSGESKLHSSDQSEWSEMSFHSDPNRFAGFCSSLTGINFTGIKTQPSSYQTARPAPIQCETKTIASDAFDELVQRDTTNSSSTSFSNPIAEESPTGIMDFAFEPVQEHKKRDISDALAFVDDDEENHVFTDKDDSFVMMKSPVKLLSTSTLFEPVFLSPSRFEI